MNLRQCYQCKAFSPEANFHKSAKGRGGLHSWCKPCTRERLRTYSMGANMKHLYGISLREALSMFAQQEGLCCVCSQPMCMCKGVTKRQRCKTRAVIDHDHKTGRVRGLVHVTCNAGMGLLADSPRLLRNAAAYLEV